MAKKKTIKDVEAEEKVTKKTKKAKEVEVEETKTEELEEVKKATKEDTNVKIDYEIAFSNEDGITVMRKCFIVVEIDKDITNIIRNCLTPEYSYNDISLSLKANTLTSKGATFIIKNIVGKTGD